MLRWRLLHLHVLLSGSALLLGTVTAAMAASPQLCPSQTPQLDRVVDAQASADQANAASNQSAAAPSSPIATTPSPSSSSTNPDGSANASANGKSGTSGKSTTASPKRAKESKPGIRDGAIDITADHADGQVEDGTARLRGHVVFHQGDREIHADEAQFNSKTNGIKTDSGIEYQDPVIHLTGNGGNYSPNQGADFRSATFDLQQRAARGSADAVQLAPQGVIKLNGVKFTTCPAAEEAWHIRANNVVLDTRNKIGDARDARVDFEGVPIFYFPWLSFPLDNERKSGFLFPLIGTNSRSGFEVFVPYYWNIAPNADLTFEPILYSKRGADLSGETRFMTSNDHGELDWNYLPYDNVAQESRSRIRVTNVMELPEDFRFSINAQMVSDSDYFEDFAQGPEGTSTAFLQQTAALTYRDEHWKLDGEFDHYQTIDYTLLQNERPYAQLPRIAASADYGLGAAEQLRYGFDSEVVNFHRSVDGCDSNNSLMQLEGYCTVGWRLDVMPHATLDINGPGYFVRPGVAWRATQYELQDTAMGAERSPSRTLPIASFDTGLLFERDTGAHAKRRLTLEPRLYYLYVPYRNQNSLPLFDTTLPDLDPVELFRNNRYVGADRVSDANQVTLALTSRLLNAHDGKQLLSGTIGQIVYFEDPRVVLPGEIPRTNGRSDFVAQLAVTAFDDWSSDFIFQWNPQASQMQRTQINLQYKPAPQAVVNLAYRFARDVLEEPLPGEALPPNGIALPSQVLPPAELLQQVELSSAWPVSRSWNVFVRGIYSIKDDKPLERFAGFEYRACCWKVRLGGRSYVSTRTGTESTGIYFQLELNGLAGVGPESDSYLTEAIRGYTPTDSQKLKGP